MVLDQASALLILALAVAVLPGLSRVLRMPAPVVEILFGVVLGKSVLGLEFGGEWIGFLGHLGFLLLMFHAGMEIDFGMLLRQRKSYLGFHLLLFLSTLALAVAGALVLGRGVFMALVLATTSLGLVMPTLKQAGLSRTPFGQGLLIAASLADFLTLFAITFFLLWHQYGISWQFVSPLPLFLGFGLALWAGRLWAWWYPCQAERMLAAEDSLEIGVRLSLALLFLFVGLSELVHLEPVLGAFLGGSVLSFVFRNKVTLESKISALGFGFLIPIFFINVGLEFDIGNILSGEQMILTLQLLAIAVLVKALPALLFTLRRMRLRQALQAGALLSSRLSLIVAAATLGLQQGLIDQETKDALVLLALLTCLLGPSVFHVFARQDKRTGQNRA
ncbi:cation:proton antiporter [Desulfohalobium retbaense]|uniref:Sodium/hydrogen exchanger n=1 Tax=Desulfohalobium retbaense (strain ATCC 49708 / DSM 5692 / JCM 16813 / HR100) TaxID=485915 RepID=C8X3T2_DESRD|nr:cation:proton antiporter [Desulfohalobium retbaense]ACV69079.1 sodium/hydrogen exchanger [Desulfohalobium retbaense DSM 5692]